MKTRFVQFFKENRWGALIGIGLSVLSFVVFFTGLAYGASCPEDGSDSCSIGLLRPIIPLLMFNAGVLMSIWMIIFFSGQQMMIFFGVVTSDSYSSSFFATSIMPAISFVLTVFVWAIIGGSVQKTYRRIRK